MIKAMQFSIMMWVFVLCNVASAQTYSIRVQFNSNLRADASLDSQVLESAPAGSVLQVVDSFNRWLKINRNGREVWMASWVSHSRIEDSGQTASQPANVSLAQVDNCCFVDRQCQSAQDWENGYWAFQNGQCAAPSQPQPQTPAQPQTSAQPVSNVPAQVDNCCFVDRQCHTDADWTDGYHAFQNNQCPVATGARRVVAVSPAASIKVWTPNMTEGVKQFLANPSSDPFNNCCYMHHNTCHSEEDWQRGAQQYQNHECAHPAPLWTLPTIVDNGTPVGSARFTDLVNTALDLIRTHAPEWLKYIQVSGVKQFTLVPGHLTAGFWNQQWLTGLGYWSEQQTDPNWAPDINYVLNYVNGITHEACHAIKQRTYTQTAGWANEVPCLEAGSAAVGSIRPHTRGFRWPRT